MFSPDTCALCWYDMEEMFAIDEWRRLPAELDAGISEMLGADATSVLEAAGQDHDDCHGLSSGALNAAADAAEFIASWRGTNTGPTRPRVVAAMRRLEAAVI